MIYNTIKTDQEIIDKISTIDDTLSELTVTKTGGVTPHESVGTIYTNWFYKHGKIGQTQFTFVAKEDIPVDEPIFILPEECRPKNQCAIPIVVVNTDNVMEGQLDIYGNMMCPHRALEALSTYAIGATFICN